MTRRHKSRVRQAKFEPRYAREVVEDLTTLGQIDPALVDAALAAVEDLLFGPQRGKLLGDRYVTGDLTGVARLRFDLPGQHPQRFRVVYRPVAKDAVIQILAIGERADHIVYRETVARLVPNTDVPPESPPLSDPTHTIE